MTITLELPEDIAAQLSAAGELKCDCLSGL